LLNVWTREPNATARTNSLITLSGADDNPTTITAAGLLNAGLYGDSLGAPWMLTNAGSVLGAGITLESAGTVTNAGRISDNGTSGAGLFLKAGGVVTNQSGGTISGGADAVTFGAGHTGRLVIDPDATFIGVVDATRYHRGHGRALAQARSFENLLHYYDKRLPRAFGVTDFGPYREIPKSPAKIGCGMNPAKMVPPISDIYA
jgi:hypothetical protein